MRWGAVYEEGPDATAGYGMSVIRPSPTPSASTYVDVFNRHLLD